ncbi:Uu.00g103730.m01.CDS01 [Anthostomella pinea]|uniref:Uu.00g103730.m01.CDS01 n=1 Tax=Anthostomella pinea TaxID=933095 RepID=A0AAI8VDQ1_9PEZI|nr:Uu.00g103730.m01.CDS01 [Anthostomella pinea]
MDPPEVDTPGCEFEPPLHTITAEQARAEASLMATSIFKNWKELQDIARRHEPNIQKRWTKSSVPKRKEILIDSFRVSARSSDTSNMPQTHNPDVAAWRNTHDLNTWKIRKTMVDENGRAINRTPFMWPHLNLEDLATKEPLLLMINARAHNPPDSFASADLASIGFGSSVGSIRFHKLVGYVMHFRGRKTADEYGQIFCAASDNCLIEALETRKVNTVAEGLWILEIQQRVYTFLVQCCRKILHDIPQTSLLDSTLAIQPQPPMPTATSTGGIQSLAVAILESQYKLPATIDFDRMEQVVDAKLEAAEDHLWSMREDPGYYESVVLEWEEHQLEQVQIQEEWGKAYPIFASFLTSKNDKWYREGLVAQIAVTAINMAEYWYVVWEKVVKLRKVHRIHQADVSPDSDLPADLARAFHELCYLLESHENIIKCCWEDCCFGCCVVCGYKGTCKPTCKTTESTHPDVSERKVLVIDNTPSMLQQGFMASPPMRKTFCRFPDPEDPFKSRIDYDRAPKAGAKRELCWLFEMLIQEWQRPMACRRTLLTELDNLTQKDVATRTYTSSWVADQIAEFSLVADCLHQISLYQPWASSFKYGMEQAFEDLQADFKNTTKYIRDIRCDVRLLAMGCPDKMSCGVPTEGRFSYPAAKRRTKENVEAMILAEFHLDNFWDSLWETLNDMGCLLSPRLKAVFERERQRTAPWIETPKPQRKQRVDHDYALSKPFGGLHLYETLDTNSKGVNKAIEKIKAKTKGKPHPAFGIQESTEETPEPIENLQPVLKVSKRALKVFRKLFFQPSVSDEPGEIEWKEFLHAMVSAGFTAVKLYGSVWHFQPLGLDVNRSIQFHEPHDHGSKITYTEARRFGRRLSRAYGWQGDTFQLAD